MPWNEKEYQRKLKRQKEDAEARMLTEQKVRECQLEWNRKMEEWTPAQFEKWKKAHKAETERIIEHDKWLQETKHEHREYVRKVRKEFGLNDDYDRS